MTFQDVIEVKSNEQTRRIELHQGDLTCFEPGDAVDLLVVSAFPNDYIPTSGSLIGALHRKGISVQSLSEDKAVDLRSAFSCWLSQPIRSSDTGIQFKRILCFEPLAHNSPPEVVGDIFRALSPFLADEPPIRTVAMPVVAAGDHGCPIDAMLEPLVEAAVNWMRIGLPVEVLKIFTYSNKATKEAKKSFKKLKKKFSPRENKISSLQRTSKKYKYDVLISYSRKDSEAANELALRLKQADRKVFIDVRSLDTGSAWQDKIDAAIEECAKVVVFYSPSYLASTMCQEEFNLARFRNREERNTLIFPIYWKSTELPRYMKTLTFFDCREEQKQNLTVACSDLITLLNKKLN